ncbi:MAG: SGNH/GDSL hydrolase family protein, partial [Aquihabitans sp.]
MPTKTLNIDATFPGPNPMARQTVVITAMTGPPGAALADLTVLAGHWDKIDLDATGHASVDLDDRDFGGDPIIYRVKTAGRTTRYLDLTLTAAATVSWGDPTILVASGTPPDTWTPLAGPPGPPGVVAATGIATYDAGTQTINVAMPSAADVGAATAAQGVLAGTAVQPAVLAAPTGAAGIGFDPSIGGVLGSTKVQGALDELADGFIATMAAGLATKEDIGVAAGLVASPLIPSGSGYHPAMLTDWMAKLATATAAPVDVVVLGDSFTVIGGVSSFPYRLGAKLAQRAGTRTPSGCRGAKTIGGNEPVMTSFAGAANAATTGGYGGTLTVGQKATHTDSMDGITVVYSSAPGAGSLIIRDGVGGTVLATVSTAGTAKSGQVWTSGALTYAARTIEIEATGGSVIVGGVYVHRGDRTQGVRVFNAGHAGWKSSDFTTDPTQGLDLISTLSTAGTLGLVLIATGTNDTDRGPELTALIAAVKTKTSAQVVVWEPYIVGSNTIAANAAGIAAANTAGVQLINGALLAPDAAFGTSMPVPLTDGVHPSNAGSEAIAAQIYGVIGGDPFGQILRLASEYQRVVSGSPTWTGGSTSVSTTNLFGYQTLKLAVTGDAEPQATLFPAALGAVFGGAGAGIGVGPGGATALDAFLSRSAAATWTVNNGAGEILARRFTGKASPRVTTIASSATPTVNTDSAELVTITALAAAITSMTSGLTGTPRNGERLVYRIKDNGTARAITWGAKFEPIGVALPTTTVASKRLRVEFAYDTVT